MTFLFFLLAQEQLIDESQIELQSIATEAFEATFLGRLDMVIPFNRCPAFVEWIRGSPVLRTDRVHALRRPSCCRIPRNPKSSSFKVAHFGPIS